MTAQPDDATPIEALIVDVEGFEGPLDLLLTLAQRQKVDLRRISVRELAEQFLAVIEQARRVRLELAADWLVMAAWLAWLKSRLLLPPDPADEDGRSAEDLAAHLAFQLERLEAMRSAAARLMARDRLGRDRFGRGAPEAVVTARRTDLTAGLHDLLTAYARLRTRDEFRPWAFDRRDVLALDQALERLERLVGLQLDWADLASFLPPDWQGAGARRRSALASSFFAALELARQGRAELRQDQAFGPLRLRRPGPESCGPESGGPGS
jgi:segregation and condensation protein A